MKQLFLTLILVFITSCGSYKETAKKETTKTVNATKNQSGDLIGLANKNMFMQPPYQTWFVKNYNKYQPNKEVVSEIKKYINNYKIKGFMGTWCGDSKRETPKFYKILEATGYNLNNLDLVTVNRSKKTPDGLEKGLNILRVPTFIFYKNGKEVGRFVEYPRKDIESDILKIVSGKEYKHSYQK